MFHVNFFLSCTLRMIILVTSFIITLNTSTTLHIVTNQTSLLKSFLINVFYTFDVNLTIFLLKITLWNPDSTNIVNPNIIADRLVCWIGRFQEIIIIRLILLIFLHHVLLFHLDEGTFLRILMEQYICILEYGRIYVNRSSFQSTSLHIAQWTRNINASWTKSSTNFTYPTISWNLSQSHTPLMKTYITHRTKYNKIIFCVVTIRTYLAFSVFNLHFFLFFFHDLLITDCFILIYFLLSFLHVVHKLFLFRMDLIHKL